MELFSTRTTATGSFDSGLVFVGTITFKLRPRRLVSIETRDATVLLTVLADGNVRESEEACK